MKRVFVFCIMVIAIAEVVLWGAGPLLWQQSSVFSCSLWHLT